RPARMTASMIVHRLDPRHFDTGTRGLIVMILGFAVGALVTAILARGELRAERALAAARRADKLRDAESGARSVEAVLTPVERATRRLADELSAGALPARRL